MEIIPPFGSTFFFKPLSAHSSLVWAQSLLPIAPHGSCFLADTHLAARGGHNRTWHTMPGQLLVTYALSHFPHKPLSLWRLQQALTCAVVETIQSFCPHPLAVQCKWPNDIVIDGKKCAGLLLQPSWQGSELRRVVFGCGINICAAVELVAPIAHTATSLHHHTTIDISSHTVLERLNQRLTRWFLLWYTNESDAITQAWNSFHLPSGTFLSTHANSGESVSGHFVRVLDDGRLVLRNAQEIIVE